MLISNTFYLFYNFRVFWGVVCLSAFCFMVSEVSGLQFRRKTKDSVSLFRCSLSACQGLTSELYFHNSRLFCASSFCSFCLECSFTCISTCRHALSPVKPPDFRLPKCCSYSPNTAEEPPLIYLPQKTELFEGRAGTNSDLCSLLPKQGP